ncbi:hypothetical protein MXE93_21105, partial [Aeromonas veronii]
DRRLTVVGAVRPLAVRAQHQLAILAVERPRLEFVLTGVSASASRQRTAGLQQVARLDIAVLGHAAHIR